MSNGQLAENSAPVARHLAFQDAVTLETHPEGRYWEVLRWFLKDSFWRFKWRTAAVLGVGFMASSLQVGVIGQIMLYAKAFANDKTFSVFGWTIETRTSISFLILFAVVTMLMLSLSAFLDYCVARWSTKLWFVYELFSTHRFLEAGSSPGLFRLADDAHSWLDGERDRLVTINCRYLGRMFKMALWLPVHCSEFFIASLILFALHWQLTIAIFVLAGVSAFLHRRISVRGMEATVRFHDYTPASRRVIYDSQHDVFANDVSPPSRQVLLRQATDHRDHTVAFGALLDRLTIPRASQMVSEIVTAISLLMVIVFFGLQAIRGNAAWGAMVGYIIAARYSLRSLQRVMTMGASVNRFVPMARDYRRALQMLNDAATENQSDKRSVCGSTSLLMMLTDGTVTRLNAMLLLAQPWAELEDTGQCHLGKAIFVNGLRQTALDGSVGHLLDNIQDVSALQAEFEAAGVDLSADATPKNMDDNVGEYWTKWSGRAKLVYHLLSVAPAPVDRLIVGPDVANQVDSAMLSYLREKHPETQVSLIGRLTDIDRWYGEAINGKIAGHIAGEYLGMGDWNWFEENRDRFEAMSIEARLAHDEDELDDDDIDLMG